jgi:hypothetical protein
VRFVDVSNEAQRPAWLRARPEDSPLVGPEYRVAPLVPPEVPSHARPPLSPLLESVRPPPMSRSPSQYPGPLSRAPSQYPGPLSRPPSQFPGSLESALDEADLLSVTRERRRDTLIEDLVPRAEEEAVLAIGSAIEQFAAERAQSLRDAEQDLIELVRVICRRIVLRELSLGTSVIEGLIQEGLEALGGGDRVTVKLGHFFTNTKDGISDNLQHKGIHCVVQIDPDLPPHGCLLTTELGRVDESVETRLDVLLSGLDSVR